MRQELQVWEGRVDFVLPVWADGDISGLVDDTGTRPVEIGIRIHYQACDDQACRIPQHASLKLTVPVGRLVGPKMGALMGGAEISSMDTGKYMLRMVRRGLLRSPIKGFRTLRKTMQNVRKGPGGRRSS